MTNSELLLNMKSIPIKDSREYDDFWRNERKKAEYGITISGVNIPPFLYWHSQLWNIYVDRPDELNNIIKRTFQHPTFRDNEWLIAEGLEEAQAARKGIMIFGSRRLGKSEFAASYIGRHATLYKGSENIITAGNWGDIDVITYKLTQGLNNLPHYFRFGRLQEGLRKEIELGFKRKDGGIIQRLSFSKIIMRNHEEGNDTEAIANITASSFVMDEVGKSKFAKVFDAAKPAFTSPYGWRCVPILTGTSGDIKKSSDAEKFFKNPEANNFIVRELKEEGGIRVSMFISGLRRMEGKIKTTLGNYIQTEKGILLPEDSELFTVPFDNTDPIKAETIIDEERLQASMSPDPTALLKATMYYPKTTKELFLSDDGNNFPIEAMLEQIAYLEQHPELQGRPVRLYRDIDNKVKVSENTNKVAINLFPLDQKDFMLKDAAVIIYEDSILNPPSYLYIAGGDPYAESDSETSDSLGSVYIYKRLYDPISGTFQRRIVAEYTARPNTLKEWHETVELLLELYNAVILPENNTSTFVQFFDGKNKGYMIADAYDFLKEISPNTSISHKRSKGLPAVPKVKAYYKELVYQYLTEEIFMLTPEQGENITKMGCIRIPSIGLLRELVAFTLGGNYDRYVAFGHVLAHEVWADKIYPFIRMPKAESTEPDKKTPPKIISPFTNGMSNPFGKIATNPFGIRRR